MSAVEHESLRTFPGAEIVPVDASGAVRLEALATLLAASAEPAIVALMLVNNETGVIQPVSAAAELAHAHGALLHCDAVQGAGRLPLSVGELGTDRSEEHTSELQSLMRISYAVFCLKKKKP